MVSIDSVVANNEQEVYKLARDFGRRNPTVHKQDCLWVYQDALQLYDMSSRRKMTHGPHEYMGRHSFAMTLVRDYLEKRMEVYLRNGKGDHKLF